MITAAGVSAGIDMALTLAARIAGDEVAQAIQLGIEYDPRAALRRRLAGEGARRTIGRRGLDAGADALRRNRGELGASASLKHRSTDEPAARVHGANVAVRGCRVVGIENIWR